MTTQPLIRDLIGWRPPGSSADKVADGVFLTLLNAVGAGIDAAIGTSGGLFAGNPTLIARRHLPSDPAEEIKGFLCMVMTGTAPWMPSVHADRPLVRMSGSAAWVVPPGIPRPVALDLAALRLVRLNTDRVVSMSDECTAAIGGKGIDVEIRGPWIAIAWLGHLAGWPDPAA